MGNYGTLRSSPAARERMADGDVQILKDGRRQELRAAVYRHLDRHYGERRREEFEPATTVVYFSEGALETFVQEAGVEGSICARVREGLHTRSARGGWVGRETFVRLLEDLGVLEKVGEYAKK